MRRSATPRHRPTCSRLMPNGLQRKPSCSALSIPASAGRGHPLFSRPTAAGTSAPATACSNWFSAAPQARAAGTSSGGLSASRPAFTDATSSRRLPPCWPGARRRLADRGDTHRRTDWPDDLSEIVYIDHFGNAMTGLRAIKLRHDAKLVATGRVLEHARSFDERAPGRGVLKEK